MARARPADQAVQPDPVGACYSTVIEPRRRVVLHVGRELSGLGWAGRPTEPFLRWSLAAADSAKALLLLRPSLAVGSSQCWLASSLGGGGEAGHRGHTALLERAGHEVAGLSLCGACPNPQLLGQWTSHHQAQPSVVAGQ